MLIVHKRSVIMYIYGCKGGYHDQDKQIKIYDDGGELRILWQNMQKICHPKFSYKVFLI